MRMRLCLFALFAAVALTHFVGWLRPLDDALRDLRFAADRRDPTGSLVLVEIDAKALDAVGVWPWPRSVHGEVLTRLLDMGADEVAFDIDFSQPSIPGEDQAFAASLEAGVVTINDVLYAWGEPAASWSGFKRSGLGHVHGRSGLQEMVRRRFVSFDPEPGLSPLFAFPYDEPADKMARTALAAADKPAENKRPKIAALITEFRRNSHAEVIVDRILEGYGWASEHYHPKLDLVAMYVDQFPEGGFQRASAAETPASRFGSAAGRSSSRQMSACASMVPLPSG